MPLTHKDTPDLSHPGLLGWLGIANLANWRIARPLGALFGCLILLLFALCVFATFSIVLATIRTALVAGGGGPNLGTGALITGLLGAPFLIWRTMVAQATVDLLKQGQITDRISRAVDQLGAEKVVKRQRRTKGGTPLYEDGPDSAPDFKKPIFEEVTTPSIEIRLGGLYALERIAHDSIQGDSGRDHLTVMEIVCAYLRENAPAADLTATEGVFTFKKPRTDIQAAVTILGRRSDQQRAHEARRQFRLDLRGVDFDGCDFRRGEFSAAQFHRCRFEAAFFDNARLHGCQFHGSLLNHASFRDSELVGANLDRVTINRLVPRSGGMNMSLNMAIIRGISLAGADLKALDYLGEAEVLNQTFVTKDTQLHHSVDSHRDDLAKKQSEFRLAKRSTDTERLKAATAALADLGITYWSPYDRYDGATGFYLKDMQEALNLTGWPYRDPA